jgi:hypothetical protein
MHGRYDAFENVITLTSTPFALAKTSAFASSSPKSTHGQRSFELVDHCDSHGTNLYNLTLGLNRSKSVKLFIEQELGSRITSLEFSRSEWDLQEPCPNGVNCPEAKHEKNRRVVLRFY